MKLVLSDGTVYHGRSFGAPFEARGEVVFNTGMVGYVEMLTDPSYRGQVLVTTYPLQGNYGVPDGPFESARIQVQGLIVHHHCDRPSHRTSTRTLGAWLRAQGIPAISGVDTRRLTRHLRTHGTIDGQLVLEEDEVSTGGRPVRPPAVDMSHVVDLVAPSEVTYHGDGALRILLVDTGAKETIIRCLQEAATLVRVPWNRRWDMYLDDVDGIVLANGPGDPTRLADPIHLRYIEKAMRLEIPILGICLGHQWLAQAAGATIVKMKYGHRSQNQPVMDLTSRRAYLTSQNHGYAVDVTTLAPDWEPWFVNLNDGTNEGIRHRYKPFRAVQFHPEAAAGPRDTRFLFEDFLRAAAESRSVQAA